LASTSYQHAAHGEVRAGEALRERDQVRCVVEALSAEPVADPAEGADHLVGAEQNPVALGDLAKALPVAARRDEAAARILDRLGDQHRDRLRPLEGDHVLDLGQERGAEGVLVVALRMAVRVRVRDMASRDRERLEGRAADRNSGERERAESDPVVRVTAGDRLATLRLSVCLVPLAGELPCRLDRLRAAGGEEDALQPGRRQAGDPPRQLNRRGMCDRPVRGERQAAHLFVGRAAELVAVRVAEVGAVEAGQAVDVAAAVCVVDVDSLAALDDRDLAVGVSREIGEMQHQVVVCQPLEPVAHGSSFVALSSLFVPELSLTL
jgi:hypothetical protein